MIVAALALALAWAEEPVPAAPITDPFAHSWALLGELEASGYPDLGAGEVIRALHDNASHPRAPLVRLQLSRYQRTHGHLLAEQHGLAAGVTAHPKWKHWFQVALLDTYLQRRDYSGLAAEVANVGVPNKAIKDAVAYYAAWGHVGSERPADAIAALSRVGGPLRPDAQRFAADLDSWDAVRRRSPAGATALSLIPGAGHVYAGRPASGFVYAAVVGGLGAGSVLLLQDDRNWAAGLLAVLTVSMWTSTAADAGLSAQGFNEAERIARLRSYEASHWIRAELTGEPEPPLTIEVGAQPSVLPAGILR